MPRSKRTKVRNMPPSQRKAVMANMSKKHRRWVRMSRSQRRDAGYLERYPVKVEEAKWFTAGGRRVGRMFLDDEELQVARDELKKDEYLDVMDPDDGETIVGPAWYKDAKAGDVQAINVCPICHRGMKKGYCMEHGSPEAYGYRWNEKKKRWDKKKQRSTEAQQAEQILIKQSIEKGTHNGSDSGKNALVGVVETGTYIKDKSDVDKYADKYMSQGKRKSEHDKPTEPSEPKGFRADPGLIDHELAMRAHSGTSMTPEKRGVAEISGFVSDVEGIHANLMRSAKTDEERALIDEEMGRFQKGYAQKWNAQMAAHSRCMSTMITGASKFPTRTAEKANRSYDNRITETNEYRERALKAINKKLNAHRIEEAGGEIEVMKQKLAVAEEAQTRMKAINKILRNKKTKEDEKTKQVHEKFGLSEHLIHELMTPDWGKPGYESWQLSNNNANIKRMKERVIDMQVKEATPSSEISFTGGTITDNNEEDRVQIFYDEKPSENIIKKLRGSGWRWAPSLDVWQRKRTDAAMYSAKQITGVS